MSTSTPERATFSIPEAAAIIGISPRFLYELVARDDFPAIRLGRRRLIPRHVIDSLLASAQLEEVAS